MCNLSKKLPDIFVSKFPWTKISGKIQSNKNTLKIGRETIITLQHQVLEILRYTIFQQNLSLGKLGNCLARHDLYNIHPSSGLRKHLRWQKTNSSVFDLIWVKFFLRVC